MEAPGFIKKVESALRGRGGHNANDNIRPEPDDIPEINRGGHKHDSTSVDPQSSHGSHSGSKEDPRPTNPDVDIETKLRAFRTITYLLAAIEPRQPPTRAVIPNKHSDEIEFELKIADSLSHVVVMKHDVIAISANRTPGTGPGNEVGLTAASNSESQSQEPCMTPNMIATDEEEHRGKPVTSESSSSLAGPLHLVSKIYTQVRDNLTAAAITGISFCSWVLGRNPRVEDAIEPLFKEYFPSGSGSDPCFPKVLKSQAPDNSVEGPTPNVEDYVQGLLKDW